MRQWERNSRGEEGEMEVWEAEDRQQQRAEGGASRGRSQERKPAQHVRKAPGPLYLHEGSQDFPGFLVDFLSIPLRVESLQFSGQPVVLTEKEGVGSGHQDLLGGSGIS